MTLNQKNDGGPVAQLGEHLVCNQGVRGSSPLRSTKLSCLVSLNYEIIPTQSPLQVGNNGEHLGTKSPPISRQPDAAPRRAEGCRSSWSPRWRDRAGI